MWQKQNPIMTIALLASAIVGVGGSLIDWGDPGGVHGTGFPAPMKMDGLPEDAPDVLRDLSNLGFYALLLNGVLAMLAGALIWAVIALALRIFRGA